MRRRMSVLRSAKLRRPSTPPVNGSVDHSTPSNDDIPSVPRLSITLRPRTQSSDNDDVCTTSPSCDVNSDS